MMEVRDDALYTRDDVLAGLKICGETLRRNIARKAFPPPGKMGRESVWPGAVLRKHFEKLQTKAETKR